ncbi:MAG: Unknown protein [uncultured Sulfurovum sp.]|uniref:Polymer-forming bactofilin n=1 Tax=uncultured Sulfurovum sp. TaxID=269237 RepID=A0A6S6U0T4_9BACT|nr:MAG: Unknown protein [uncultured Sulfurovum sp.]
MSYNIWRNLSSIQRKLMFKGNKKTTGSTTNSKNTHIAKEIEISGNLKGTGDVQVEGILNGDISVTSVIIGQDGTVNGTINATNVIINGKLDGSVFCDTLEVMSNGVISHEIRVKQLLISGKAEGSIEAKDEINIETTGVVNAESIKSKNILVNGYLKGKVTASELLEVGSQGSVEGEITIKNIKTHEGGKLIGSMHNYEEVQSTKLAEESILK